MKKTQVLFVYLFVTLISVSLSAQSRFSTAGFYEVENTGRKVFSMNPAWRFYKGDVKNAQNIDFDDQKWNVVSLPHGIEYLPAEASGGVNYQGVVWYRKHFTLNKSLKNKELFLHFEAIQGKCKIYVNGKMIGEHFGGFLPIVVPITNEVNWQENNVISVRADNSNDPTYPPGKAQEMLDFTYFGGIYRDCWLVAHNKVFITNPNYENKEAGGGLFVAFNNVSEVSAEILLKAHIRNTSNLHFSGTIEYELFTPDGKKVAFLKNNVQVNKNNATSISDKIKVESPHLWSPSSPSLYKLEVRILDYKNRVIDGYYKRIGIRSIEFKGAEGFWLNGKPYPRPLIGANRHQDFAVVGNALPNSMHWRDAKKLKAVGLEVIRNAHYPQDPAFMDACDELGLFVIVNTPGWQFWSDAPEFGKRVYNDIRNMVRRDRNHPSVWLWEPILNETWYPDDFAKNAHDIVKAEYPYPYCYSGCDNEARGKEHFPVLFTHPSNGDKEWAIEELDATKTYFTREWGDNVDDWNSHNSPSRVERNWGEQPMLIQAQHYANPPYKYTSYNSLYQTSKHHIGGCLWHSFDHQRGYHPDPFFGGIMDAFRQPKYSYYLFQAQRPIAKDSTNLGSGAMVYIAHQMTPFSNKDVTVYSNCDEVRLTVNKGGKTYVYKKSQKQKGMPSPIIVFKDAFDFMVDKHLSMVKKKQNEVYLLAEGFVDGKKVATHKVAPARRPEQLLLWIDDDNIPLTANGSDLVTVVAAIADKNGNIKRLNNQFIHFTIQGEGRLLGSKDMMTNPVPVKWGTAPILVQSTTQTGSIKIAAQVLIKGSQTPLSAEIELKSIASKKSLLYAEKEMKAIANNIVDKNNTTIKTVSEREIERLKKEINALKLKEVERQQAKFGEKNKK